MAMKLSFYALIIATVAPRGYGLTVAENME